MDRDLQLENLHEQDYFVIDFLPEQVSDRNEILENVEAFYMSEKELERLAEKFVNIILKTWCYFDFEIFTNRWVERPNCETLELLISNIVRKQRGSMSVLLSGVDALIEISAGSLNMTVYNANTEVENILEKLAISEGLFCWQPK